MQICYEALTVHNNQHRASACLFSLVCRFGVGVGGSVGGGGGGKGATSANIYA